MLPPACRIARYRLRESRRIILRNSYESSGRLEDICVCYEGQGSITPIIAAPASNAGVVLERVLHRGC
jgi:hypothetical protein